MKELLMGVMRTLFKMSDQEIAEVLENSANGEGGIDEAKVLTLIIDKDKERIQKLKDAAPKWDDAVKKATKEVWSKVEGKLKEKFGVDSDLQGDDLIEFINTSVNEKLTDAGKKGEGKPAEITDDDIKKHRLYMELERNSKKLLAEKDKEYQNKLQELEQSFTQKERLSQVRNSALSIFKSIDGVVLPEDAAKADIRIQRLLLSDLDNYNYEPLEDGDYLVTYKDGDKKGKRVEDAHGHPVSFKDLVINTTKNNFEIKVSKERRSPGNGGEGKDGGEGGKKLYTGKAPATVQEYASLLLDPKLTNEQKIEIKTEYGEQFSK